jgi:hypothetical protein
MMKVELANLKERIEEIVHNSPFKTFIGHFELDEGQYDDGIEFVRVIFDLNAGSKISDEDLLRFAKSVENSLACLDERFASIRFSDAA